MILMRWDIINHLIKQNGYKSYLEIGYYKGWSFDRVECSFKTAVDPNPSKYPEQESSNYKMVIMDLSTETPDSEVSSQRRLCKMTSDEFFSLEEIKDQKWDIIFVDGLHTGAQAYKDVMNAFNHLNESGVVVMHDCNPPSIEHTTTGVDGCWTGDVYKAAAALNRSIGLEFVCVDIDWGVGVIRKTGDIHWMDYNNNPPVQWNFFNTHRKTCIGLISPEEWLEHEELVHS